MTKYKKEVIFSLYVFFTLTALIYASIKLWVPLTSNDYSIILVYLFAIIIINSYPIKLGRAHITFIYALSLPVFLQFGVIVEALLVQIALLVSFLITDTKRTFTRIIFNQMMFVWMSLTAGLLYFMVGGRTGFTLMNLYDQIFPIFLYTFVYFLVNSIIINISFMLISEEKFNIDVKDLAWGGIALIFSLPFGLLIYLTVYIVKDIYGPFPMFMITLQFVLFIFLFRFYSQLLQSHQQIKTLDQLATTYTSELNIEKTITALQQAYKEVLTYDYSNIYVVNETRMSFIASMDANANVIYNPFKDNECKFNKSLLEKVIASKQTLLLNTETEILFMESEQLCKKGCKSFISAPMIWRNKVIGIINFASRNENHFTEDDVNIVNILASQGALAIRNAAAFQKVEEKGLIDELTGIYNFRAFNNFLNDMLEEAKIKGSNLSLMMIDLDHFKKVNDCYGHQNGNIVLQEIAQLLQRLMRKEDIVARYGGEEFTIIIPDANAVRAREIAERVRMTLEEYKIRVKDSLNDNKEITINITASIGLSTYPEVALSANDLIRYSDRALYVGSKKKGRNKVSVYQDDTGNIL